MKKSVILSVVIAIGVALWVVSGVVAPREDGAAAQKSATVLRAASKGEAAAPQVRVRDSVAENMAARIVVTGRTTAYRNVELRAETDGQIVEIVTPKGSAVKQGDVIARIAERDRKVRVNEARQRVNQRQIEFNAAQQLEEKGFNSRVRLAQTRADLESARAELHRAEIDLANIALTAPFDGIIAAQRIELGDYVGVGAGTFVIVDLDPIRLAGFLTERQVGAVNSGEKVTAHLLDGRMVEGVLTYVAPSADVSTRTFAFEAEVPNPDNAIVEGMTASVQIPLARGKAHRISPAILTLDDTGRVGVKIVDADNRVDFITVEIIADEPTHMWIGGLPDEVRLITVGQEFVVAGQIVTPVPETAIASQAKE